MNIALTCTILTSNHGFSQNTLSINAQENLYSLKMQLCTLHLSKHSHTIQGFYHNSEDDLRFSLSMESMTTWKTTCILLVSVAVVKWG